MAYATYSDVHARLGGRPAFTASSKPTQAQVTAWIDEAEAMLNGTLLAAELPAPYSSTQAVNILKHWVTSYVEGRVRQTNAAAGGDGSNDDGRDLVDAFEVLLDKILANPSRYGAMLGAGAAPDSARVIRGHVLDNQDGDTISDGDFTPTFTREETF